MITLGCKTSSSQARPEIRVPSVMPRNAGIFCVRILTAICNAITVSESAMSSISVFVLAFT